MHLTITVSLMSILLTGSAPAAEPRLLQRWQFHVSEDARGWVMGSQLTDFGVIDGRLHMTITGTDPYFFSPAVDFPLDGCLVRARMKCDRDGATQVYWTIGEQPSFSEERVTGYITPASDELKIFDFAIGKPADLGTRLIGFRIDPYNNPEGAGNVEIESVELWRAPPVFDVQFALESHQVQVGQELAARLRVRLIDGQFVREKLLAHVGFEDIKLSATTQPVEVGSRVQFEKPGVQQVRATLHKTENTPEYDLQTSVIVGKDEALPILPLLRSERFRLDLLPEPDGKTVGGARWQIFDGQGTWRTCGWLLPLAEFIIEHEGRIIARHPSMTLGEHDARNARLSAVIDDEWQIDLALMLIEKNGAEAVEAISTLYGPQGGRLLGFSLPVLRAEPAASDLIDRYGLFGGLEFLEPGWRSSSERAVGAKFADRWSPHPFKITLPVMAVESGGITTAMMWQPLDRWADDNTMPAATFASPNFLDGQDNHLMQLSIPSIPKWRNENERSARSPYIAEKDQPIVLRCLYYAEPNLPVAKCSQRWHELFGPPTPPPTLYDDRTLYDFFAQNFGKTMYWPGRGWQFHWFHMDKQGHNGLMAGELVAYSLDTGEKKWVEATGLKDRSIIEAAGPLSARLKQKRPRALLQNMRPDGTYAFVNTEKMRAQTREFTNNEHDSLGEDGSTSLGTCVQAMMPILHHAELTGDPECIAAVLKTLEAMRRFRVPRGAQVWEVHQQIPDIRAAALAVQAYQTGYRLTGDERWLDDATYWAWAGVPFLYSWHVPIEQIPGRLVAGPNRDDPSVAIFPLSEVYQKPKRQITPFASVPVLGPTFYVVNWFGVVVQWCGLEWALKVIELDRDRPDPMLRYIADGVVASGLQQMFDREPWVGLYPDAWTLQTNQASRALLSSTLLLQCLQAQGRLPRWSRPWSRVQRDTNERQWHVSGWGQPVHLSSPDPVTWSAVVTMPVGQPNELIVAGVEKPERVRAGEILLQHEPTPEFETGSSGWWYMPEPRAVLIHFKQTAEQTSVRIDW